MLHIAHTFARFAHTLRTLFKSQQKRQLIRLPFLFNKICVQCIEHLIQYVDTYIILACLKFPDVAITEAKSVLRAGVVTIRVLCADQPASAQLLTDPSWNRIQPHR